ncbi:metal ABC transporter ATP-binding protein [Sabulicella rubraurantiaca]|uniref:metal ABC transporter ATP-binding protein n=1 Tax=Sabulicella rubraurantiaca TaxID=2811429 RepID=UPI001A959409|nr:metal ABC transporter ATP-binding protein [Sabulicella rubraurantiaca]
MTPPLSLHGVSVRYGDRPALSDVTWDAVPGLTAILGPNGAGKSTLLRAALGLVPATGEVRFFGRTLAEVRNRVAFLPQRASVDWDFPATALDVVGMARLPRLRRWWGRLPRADRDAALAALDAVGMADFAARQIGRLSGGQQQRVFLARALAQQADLFLMDEPLAAVDAVTERAIIAVLHRLVDDGKTVLMVHHDLSLVSEHFTDVLLLAGRVIAAGPVREAFTEDSVARAFGGLPRMMVA